MSLDRIDSIYNISLSVLFIILNMKSKKQINQASEKNTLLKYFPKQTALQDENHKEAQVKPSLKRKVYHNRRLDEFLSIGHSLEEQPEKTYIISEVVRSLAPQQVFKQIPNLNKFVRKIQLDRNLGSLLKQIVYNFLSKPKNLLWSDKYLPTCNSDAFQPQNINCIEYWLHNIKPIQYPEDSTFTSVDSTTKKVEYKPNHSKKCLIVFGKQGIGKMALLRALAKKMKIQIYECTNEVDRITYLREKRQSTKSESILRKKENKSKDRKNVLDLNKFFIKIQNPQQNQLNKIHVIHHINEIFPNQKKLLFKKQLKTLMDQSRIPFIFTTTSMEILRQYKSFDILNFLPSSTQYMTKYFWLLVNIQKNLENVYNSQKSIAKQKIFQQINFMFQNLEFRQIINYSEILKLIEMSRSNFNLLFNFFQYIFNQQSLQSNERYILSQLISFPINLEYLQKQKEYYNFAGQSIQQRLFILDRQINQQVILNCNSNFHNVYLKQNWSDITQENESIQNRFALKILEAHVFKSRRNNQDKKMYKFYSKTKQQQIRNHISFTELI